MLKTFSPVIALFTSGVVVYGSKISTASTANILVWIPWFNHDGKTLSASAGKTQSLLQL